MRIAVMGAASARTDPRISADIDADRWRQAIGAILATPAKGVRLEPDVVERMLAVAASYQYDARVSMRLGVPVPFHDIAYACLEPLAK